MAIRVALHHVTRYDYDRLIQLGPQIVRLRPAPHSRTPILSYSLQIEPEKHFINWQQDPQGNFLARLVFPDKTTKFHVAVDLVADMTIVNPFDFFLEPAAEQMPFQYDEQLSRELRPFLELEKSGPKLASYVEKIDLTPRRTIDFLVELNQRLQHDIKYIIRMEPGVQSAEETLTLCSGSCRDSAWLLVQILRSLGYAARFVSGYLIQLVADVKPLEGPSGTDKDFTDLHAWTEVYLPGAGWVGLDPTSGLFAGEGHIPLACTPDPVSAAPITGGLDPCETVFAHEMSVSRIYEDPRVTKPYTDRQWETIEALGHTIDQRLKEQDVRMTMGGEPTFVSIDDMDGPEWNFTADSEAKRKLACNLLRRLHGRFAQGGLLQHGQGKWYPGEPLPRWAFGCYWRRDREPIWTEPKLFAEQGVDYKHGQPQAKDFMAALAERLGVGSKWMVPAYEDVWYYLWKERRLPTNVDPLQSNLDDPQERLRISRIFEQGLNAIVGYVLPLRPRGAGASTRWMSGPWFVRREHMYLLPGDSPLGFRLPLDSLLWQAPAEREQVLELDPFASRGPLPSYSQFMNRAGDPLWLREMQRAGNGDGRTAGRQVVSRQPLLQPVAASGIAFAKDDLPGGAGLGGLGSGGPGSGSSRGGADWPNSDPDWAPFNEQDTSSVIRTALCVEPRNGRLHVFLPPVGRLEDFLDLATALEQTAAELRMPVVLEGYRPPRDPRLNHFMITPDPGVIEVNIHPADTWDELVENTTILYDEARQARLGTEKFMLDGRHTGTGGGNHVVLGGPTAADSPFLRRPDLLKSLVGYWHNHPSLSYLFSGLFLGPTSQAPRVDEGRRDAVYELDLAFQQVQGKLDSKAPWLTDRIFRHLLVDLTGNTHRSEFCIDKLYSPDTADGRRGLVEFRAFEMPPHARMSLTQQLLLRSLVAKFWDQPYETKLVNWDTTLHDRFMLPYFLQLDFADVIEEVRKSGMGLQEEWFAPHFEFRFPVMGQVTQRGIALELRTAVEPWYVLGEEPAGGAMSRYVDSSVERLQILVRGMTDPRYVIACNGRKVPLHPTGTEGEYIAGVRYRAWQPPSCLHPTIPVDAPLTFDVLDTWLERSLGGCTYHVAHPGGRSYNTFPVNAYEAESRRVARFFKIGHTGGRFWVPAETPTRDYPLTLDLRREPSR